MARFWVYGVSHRLGRSQALGDRRKLKAMKDKDTGDDDERGDADQDGAKTNCRLTDFHNALLGTV